MSQPQLLVLTIGHSNRTLYDFLQILQVHGVEEVVDVRTVPRSRRNPQFNWEALPAALGLAAIEYLHLAKLGGLRRPAACSLNTGWRNASFRGFADYMQTPEFEENLEGLLGLASHRRIALMCAEALPWRCHRSLIADALTVRGVQVEHIMSPARRQGHKLTPWAQVNGTHIVYPLQDTPAGA